MLVDETTNAVIASTHTISGHETVDINDFHVAHAHAHEGALMKTLKQVSLNLEGEMFKCKGCLMAKHLRMPISKKTDNRGIKILSRVYVDLGGKRCMASVRWNKYPMIVRDDFSRYAWVSFISHMSDAAEAFEAFLADPRVDGFPSEVVVVRSDDGGELNEVQFGKLCREWNIMDEFTTGYSPEFNGVAERGLAMIESAALAARIQAPEFSPGINVPDSSSLWAEAMSWACNAYNRTVTVANPENRSPYEMFYEEIPKTAWYPF